MTRQNLVIYLSVHNPIIIPKFTQYLLNIFFIIMLIHSVVNKRHCTTVALAMYILAFINI